MVAHSGICGVGRGNKMYYLGVTSSNRLTTCRPETGLIIRTAIKTSPIDFGVVCGGRGKFLQEKSKLDGFSDAGWGESDHNIMKGDKLWSPAVDVAPYSAELRDYIWDDNGLWYILHNHIRKTADGLGYKMICGIMLKGGKKDFPHCLLVY